MAKRGIKFAGTPERFKSLDEYLSTPPILKMGQ